MKTFIFEDEDLLPDQIKDTLDAECIGVEEHEFIKPFTDDQIVDVKENHIKLSKDQYRLKAKIKALLDPLKAELKEVTAELNPIIKQLDEGGIRTKEAVYLFSDPKNKMMGQYDETGMLVGTRPMNQHERNQLNINSYKRDAS